jgi:hypothetical protein
MATGNLTADGSTPWVHNKRADGKHEGAASVHASVNGTLGGGTVLIEKRVEGNIYPVYDLGTPASFTAPDDLILSLGIGDTIRLRLTGSAGANVDWIIAGDGAQEEQ